MCDEVKYVVINLMSIFFGNKLIKTAHTNTHAYAATVIGSNRKSVDHNNIVKRPKYLRVFAYSFLCF